MELDNIWMMADDQKVAKRNGRCPAGWVTVTDPRLVRLAQDRDEQHKLREASIQLVN